MRWARWAVDAEEGAGGAGEGGAGEGGAGAGGEGEGGAAVAAAPAGVVAGRGATGAGDAMVANATHPSSPAETSGLATLGSLPPLPPASDTLWSRDAAFASAAMCSLPPNDPLCAALLNAHMRPGRSLAAVLRSHLGLGGATCASGPRGLAAANPLARAPAVCLATAAKDRGGDSTVGYRGEGASESVGGGASEYRGGGDPDYRQGGGTTLWADELPALLGRLRSRVRFYDAVLGTLTRAERSAAPDIPATVSPGTASQAACGGPCGGSAVGVLGGGETAGPAHAATGEGGSPRKGQGAAATLPPGAPSDAHGAAAVPDPFDVFG